MTPAEALKNPNVRAFLSALRYWTLNRAARTMNAFRSQIGRMGKLGRWKRSKVAANAVNYDARLESSFDFSYAHKSSFAVRSNAELILLIERVCRFSQISDPVVLPNSIDVVYLINRPSASHVEPCEAMRKMFSTFNSYLQVAFGTWRSCNVTDLNAICASSQTRKNASLRIVSEKFAQALRSKIDSSHDALLMLIGQRPVSVISTAPALLF